MVKITSMAHHYRARFHYALLGMLFRSGVTSAGGFLHSIGFGTNSGSRYGLTEHAGKCVIDNLALYSSFEDKPESQTSFVAIQVFNVAFIIQNLFTGSSKIFLKKNEKAK